MKKSAFILSGLLLISAAHAAIKQPLIPELQAQAAVIKNPPASTQAQVRDVGGGNIHIVVIIKVTREALPIPVLVPAIGSVPGPEKVRPALSGQ